MLDEELLLEMSGMLDEELLLEIPGMLDEELLLEIPGMLDEELLLEIPGTLDEELLLEIPGMLDEELLLEIFGTLDEELLETLGALDEELLIELLELCFTAFLLIHRLGCQSSSPSTRPITLLSDGFTRAIFVCAPFVLARVAMMRDLEPSVAHSVWSNVEPLGALMVCISFPILSAIRMRSCVA